jgi:hypothetical protein
MPRILKRPMFSRGGTTKKNNGIMTGLVDRTSFDEGTPSPFSKERTSADVKAMMDAMNEYAPVTKQRLNLGKVGLNLASGKYSGGDLISTLAGAGSDIYDDYTTKDDAYRAAIAKRKQAAVSSSLSQQLAERKALAAAKQKDQFITLSDGQAKNELKGAYVPGVLYQKNLTTGKIEAKQFTVSEEKIPTNKVARNTSDQVINGVEPGKTGFFTNEMINASGGQLTPVDDRMITLPDGRVIPYEEYKKTETKQDLAREVVASVDTLDKLKNRMLSQLKETPTGMVGAVFGILEGTSDQFSQATQALGFNNESLEFDVNSSAKLDKYLEGKGITKGAANFATMKGSVINLAYILAKIKEPNNPKLSEGDIIRQLDRIKFGASRDVFAAGLNNVFEEELISAKGQIIGYGFKPEDYFKEYGQNTETSTETNTGKKQTFDPLNILPK